MAWLELASTYVGLDIEDHWAARFRTSALFRRVATEVGEALGYTYPQPLHDRVTAYLTAVRRTPRRDVSIHSDDLAPGASTLAVAEHETVSGTP
jgi:hypothetical protein